MHRKIIGIILLQILICLYLGFVISKNKSEVLGDTSITQLQSLYYEINQESAVKSYYEPKANIEYVEVDNGYSAKYTINNDTLNERLHYQVDKRKETLRIVTLGDSFTFGVLVDTDDNWTERLEKMLNKNLKCDAYKAFEVINLGVPGYDIEYALERYKIRGSKYAPDLVIWLIKGDDLWQQNRVIRPQAHRYTLENKGKDQTAEYDPWIKAVQDFKKDTNLEELIGTHQKHLNEFETMYKGKVIYGYMDNTSNDKDDRIISAMLRDRANHYLSASYFKFPDIYQNKYLVIPGNGHPTADGHEVMAESLFTYLAKSSILCN